ncbi:MAG: SIS domain-containing protein [Hyphomicrobiales bacterium]|nr:MAG: SIS domain-containing protein [Hyphomicrobiales bacterium]
MSTLSPSEQAVAQFVLLQPDRVLRMTLAALAAESGVSEPTVIRFVRSLGLSGFPELKLLTGQSLASGTAYLHSAVAREDKLDTVVDKVFDSSVYVLNTVRESLDRAALARSVELLAKAQRIDLFGCGSAGTLALDAQIKFMRLGIPAINYADTHVQRVAASTLGKGDVALCFSYTGALQDICKIASTIRAAGAKVIAMTRANSPLAGLADEVVGVDTLEDHGIYLPQSSRVAYDVVLDIISTSVAMKKGRTAVEQIKRTKEISAEFLIPPDAKRRRKAGTASAR